MCVLYVYVGFVRLVHYVFREMGGNGERQRGGEVNVRTKMYGGGEKEDRGRQRENRKERMDIAFYLWVNLADNLGAGRNSLPCSVLKHPR